ncbi:MAG: hypothetical protein M1817_005943 [Caeruleum heppii]|nr:MAG: hypothetical protein M1817_005943 [Caeruleum heppii]
MDQPQDPARLRYALPAPSISEIIPGLFIGNERCSEDRETLHSNRINAVISLVSSPTVIWRTARFTDYIRVPDRHLWIECLDSSTQDLLVHMSHICDFIHQMLERGPAESPQLTDSEAYGDKASTPSEPPQGRVLVHCSEGISRSGTIVVAYLMREQRLGRDEVLANVRMKRPRVKPSSNFMDQLDVWKKTDYQIWKDKMNEVPTDAYQAFLERRALRLKEKGLTGNEPCRPLDLTLDD